MTEDAATGRRRFLKKAAVGAGVVWTAPVVTSIGASAQFSGCTCGSNLVVNGGAETGDTTGWTNPDGNLTAHQYGAGAFPPST